jgi:PEP-CTERM/exosortase A-associated glycosyltransferase
MIAGLPVLGHWGTVRAIRRRMEEVISEVEPDVIHAHSPLLNGIAALSVGRRHRVPVVYEVRAFWEDAAVDHGTSTAGGVRYRLSRALETYVLRRTDAVTVICEGLRRDIVGRGVPSESITVIPNAVDLAHFPGRGKPDLRLSQRLALDGCPTLGFIGSFYAYEGISMFLDALPAVLKEHPRARALLVGGGPQEQQLRQRVIELGISDKVVFTGRVPHGEVQRYYDLVDVFVYPRIRVRLTELVTPLKPLEAMAQEAIVIASDVGGHRELIEDGSTGILFEAGNPGALARALSEVLRNPESWRPFGRRAREFVETTRTWRVSVERYLGVYRSVLAKGGPKK